MNKQDELFLTALSEDRAESADMLEKPSMRGIKNSVVEKYESSLQSVGRREGLTAGEIDWEVSATEKDG